MAAARLCTEPRVPCRRNRAYAITSAEGAFQQPIAASCLGYRKLLIAKKGYDAFPSLRSFAQRRVRRVSRGSSDEQECAQAFSYDVQLFDNLPPQTTGHRAGPGGRRPSLILADKQCSQAFSTRKGGLKAHKALKAHTPPRRNLSKRGT
jgi:hypothetical protein